MTINRIAVLAATFVLGTALGASAQTFPRRADSLDPVTHRANRATVTHVRVTEPVPVPDLPIVRQQVDLKLSGPRLSEYLRFSEPAWLPAPVWVHGADHGVAYLPSSAAVASARPIDGAFIARIMAGR